MNLVFIILGLIGIAAILFLSLIDDFVKAVAISEKVSIALIILLLGVFGIVTMSALVAVAGTGV
jgi:hypothetical protein